MPVREKAEVDNAHAAEMRHEQAVHQGRRPACLHRQPMQSALAPPPPTFAPFLPHHRLNRVLGSSDRFQTRVDGAN